MNTDRSRNRALVAGALLIAFGLLSLAGQLFRNMVSWSFVWPLAVILFGSLFFAGMFAGGRQFSGLAIPGAIVTGIGLMLLYQNLTSHWESWAYSWTLIVLFVGAGISMAGWYGADERQKAAGLRLMRMGLVMFVLFGAFFEMIFSIDRPLGLRGMIFPFLLILLGVYLIIRRLGWLSGKAGKEPDSSIPPTLNQ